VPEETTLQKCKRLEREATDLSGQAEIKTKELMGIQNSCDHQFPPKATYDPIIYKGYHSQGDPEGTMGVDRRLPSYIPGRTIDQWTRTCGLCGLTQTTKRSQQSDKRNPVF